jgi:hypothetical protein
MPVTTRRPAADEFAPYYASYIALVPEGDLLATLRAQADTYRALFADVPDERRSLRYAPGKWSLAESLLHVTDTERVFAYRALRIARGDATTPLPGFDQDAWVPASMADARSLADLVDEFVAVRQATLALLTGLPDAAWDRRGIASNATVSVRALAFMIAGHAAHHAQLFRDHYLP